MTWNSFVASTHYLALGFGLGGLLMRAHFFRDLSFEPHERNLRNVFKSDGIWGLAAILWLATGSSRAFGGLEKGTEYYLNNPYFWIKMSLFLGLFLLEIYPMVTLWKWRTRKGIYQTQLQRLNKLRFINRLELLVVISIVYIAGLMAR
jgi:putative membrane protein